MYQRLERAEKKIAAIEAAIASGNKSVAPSEAAAETKALSGPAADHKGVADLRECITEELNELRERVGKLEKVFADLQAPPLQPAMIGGEGDGGDDKAS